MSSEAKDLVKKLLTYEPSKRISAAEAIQHPWIKKQADQEKVEKSLATNALSNLKAFRVNSEK